MAKSSTSWKIKKQALKKSKKKHPGGRSTLLTKEKMNEICGYIENGLNYTAACLLSNISQSIFYEWKKKGKNTIENNKKNEFSEFLDKIHYAKAKRKMWLLQNVNNAVVTDGKLCLDLLSRLYPDEYGKKDKLDIKKKVKGVKRNKTVVINNTDERVGRILGIVEQIRGIKEKPTDKGSDS